jgi:anti-anti-sigma factor
MSSAGLRVLVAVHKATKKNGGGLCLAQPSTRREVLDLAGLTPVFDVHGCG